MRKIFVLMLDLGQYHARNVLNEQKIGLSRAIFISKYAGATAVGNTRLLCKV